MKQLREAIIPHVIPVIERSGAFLIDLAIKAEHRSRVVQLLVDTDLGISIDACANLSRELGPVLEAAGLFDGPYRLEVSSPGLDRPLRLLRQYPKNIGRRFRVRFRAGETSQEFHGRLTAVAGAQLTFEPDERPAVEIQFDQILECKEELPW